MFCVKCGKEIDTTEELCTVCQYKVNGNTDSQEDQHSDQVNFEENKEVKESKVISRVGTLFSIGLLQIIFYFVPVIPSTYARVSMFDILKRIPSSGFSMELHEYFYEELRVLTEFINGYDTGFFYLPILSIIYAVVVVLLFIALAGFAFNKKGLFLVCFRISAIFTVFVSLIIIGINGLFVMELNIDDMLLVLDSMFSCIIFCLAFAILSLSGLIIACFKINKIALINQEFSLFAYFNNYKFTAKIILTIFVCVILLLNIGFFYKSINYVRPMQKTECEIIDLDEIKIKRTFYDDDFKRYEDRMEEVYDYYEDIFDDEGIDVNIDMKHIFPNKVITTVEWEGLKGNFENYNYGMMDELTYHMPLSIKVEDFKEENPDFESVLRERFYNIDSDDKIKRSVAEDLDNEYIVRIPFQGYVTFKNNDVLYIDSPKDVGYFKISNNTYYFYYGAYVIID
ncbi:hypothetical protein [Vallitalea okinawensis]|uniref:hypothetical protein n=1 Tax=Vallitalea okinawensis TaxID=2078660 RepID=UPI000CFD8EE4|nr:hypothetical protein [Vallitalea okinawensis]